MNRSRRTGGVACVILALLAAACDEANSGGSAGAGGSGASGAGGAGGSGGGAGGGSVTIDDTCPAAPLVPTRIATTFYELPPPVSAMGYSRITSIVVGGEDVYFTATDMNGPMIRTVKTDGTGESVAFQDPGFAPLSRLAGVGQTLYWFDQSGDPGRVVQWGIGDPMPSVVFDEVLLGDLGEMEHYFDLSNNHFIHANVRAPDGSWRNELLRRNASDGSIDVLYSRDNDATGGAYFLSYAFLGETFYLSGHPSNVDDVIAVLPVSAGGAPIDPLNPPAITPAYGAPCQTLVALGEKTLWCVGATESVGQIPDVTQQQVLRAMRRDPLTGDEVWTEIFDSFEQPDEPGRGLFAWEVATNGPDLYFVASEVTDGVGNVVSTIYRARDTGSTFEVTTVLCGLPEVTDMTLTGDTLYFATFESDVDQLDQHGLWRLDL